MGEEASCPIISCRWIPLRVRCSTREPNARGVINRVAIAEVDQPARGTTWSSISMLVTFSEGYQVSNEMVNRLKGPSAEEKISSGTIEEYARSRSLISLATKAH
jgi:hypothetical protein